MERIGEETESRANIRKTKGMMRLTESRQETNGMDYMMSNDRFSSSLSSTDIARYSEIVPPEILTGLK
jgi:hypothetical protein